MAELECRLAVPAEGSSKELVPESSCFQRAWTCFLQLILSSKLRILRFSRKIWKLGVDDPRRVFHCLKVGVALTLVSLFYYMRPLYDGVGGTAMWAIMTAVVVFEYTVGGTISRGINRGVATFLAGSLGFGVHALAVQSGQKAETIIRSFSIFLLEPDMYLLAAAGLATFSRFVPTVKARFEYGVTVFILTLSLVSVSGYRVDKVIEMAHRRLITIAIGGSMCMLTSMLICPVWAGEDLHSLVIRNMEKLATSLDGCVVEYFDYGKSPDGAEESCQRLQGYRCLFNTKATEEALANFARWEPPHGCFSFRHPWKQYLKIGAALRFCAYCLDALDASTNSQIKITTDELGVKKHLRDAFTRLSSKSCEVLKELAVTLKTMRRSSKIEFLVGETHAAVQHLQNALKSIPDDLKHMVLQSPTSATEARLETGTSPAAASKPNNYNNKIAWMETVLPLITLTSLIIEITARIEGVVHEVDELARLADFKPAVDST
ncbi:hypothetical protein ACLOJK_005008 [Asimina triloba]